jgi:hypothetical protein
MLAVQDCMLHVTFNPLATGDAPTFTTLSHQFKTQIAPEQKIVKIS